MLFCHIGGHAQLEIKGSRITALLVVNDLQLESAFDSV